MRKLVLAMSMALALVVPAFAKAKPPTRIHVKQYVRAYAAARRHFGAKAVGCNLIGKRGSCHTKVTDARLVRSLAVISRFYTPPPAPVYYAPSAASYQTTQVTPYTPTATAGGLVGCIIKAESGGSTTVMNSSGHGGLAGWSQSTWQQDVAAEGKTGYPSSPTAATYSQQLSVLRGEGSTPQGFGQQTNFDPC